MKQKAHCKAQSFIKLIPSGKNLNITDLIIISMTEKNLNELENRIIELKKQILTTASGRRAVAAKGDERAMLQMRIKLAEQAIENCDLLVNYLSLFSPTLAARLEEQQKSIKNEIEKIKMVNNEAAFHDWVKRSLIPFLKQTEQIAYVAATSSKSTKAGVPVKFSWTKGVVEDGQAGRL